MKRVKISIVIMLLLITLSLTILSGCSVNLEKINEKNAEAIEFGFYTQSLEDYLQEFNDETREEFREQLNGCDYMLCFRASEEIISKYDYIAVATRNNNNEKLPNGEVLKKNEIYVNTVEIMHNIAFIGIKKNARNFLAIAFLTKEQYRNIIQGEDIVLAFYTETLWKKALQVSDKVIEWNL